jgi:nucleoside-triphosphatase
MINRKLLLTGVPSCGKTTIIKKIVHNLNQPAKGFYTEEIRVRGKRMGFKLVTLSGEESVLAHMGIQGKPRVSRYGVNVKTIDEVGISAITPENEGQVIVLDEIGKMECVSERFRNAVRLLLDSPNSVIGTIAVKGSSFIREIREREDVELIEVNSTNRDEIPQMILNSFTRDKK